jgi:acetyl-CoA C-acetyltransferase
MQKEIVIVSAARTPFGRFGGSLKDYDYYDLGAIPIREVVKRVNIDPGIVEEVNWGVGDTSPCKDVYTPCAARQTLLKAGLSPTTVSMALDKACVSAMTAVKLGTMAMKLGEIDIAIGGGATSFSREPLILRGLRLSGFRIGNVTLEDPLFALGAKDYAPGALETGHVAIAHGISREEQDEWALRSHQNYGDAWSKEKFRDEMIVLEIPQKGAEVKILDIDEQYRSDTSLEKLAKLPTIYGSPTVTAGNSPGLNDGATAILFMTKSKADELGLQTLASIVAMCSVAIQPDRMAEGPAYAIRRVLQIADMTLDDIPIMEINEAFAAMPLVSTKMLAEGNKNRWEAIKRKTNINGSAIAIGHPNTSSGARIIMTLMYELRRRGGGYALGAICGGLAQADAVIIKVE